MVTVQGIINVMSQVCLDLALEATQLMARCLVLDMYKVRSCGMICGFVITVVSYSPKLLHFHGISNQFEIILIIVHAE